MYRPWSIVKRVDVPVQGLPGATHIRVPWAAGLDTQALVETGTITAFLTVRAAVSRIQHNE